MNKKRHYVIASVLVLVCLGILIYIKYPKNNFDGGGTLDIFDAPSKPFTFDPKNAEYEIEGQKVLLVDGHSEVAIEEGSATKVATEYFGNEAYSDIDGDNDNDFVYLITQSTGGTGTFYYAVAGLRVDNTYKITNTVFVGDRIAPQSTDINEDTKEIRVNFADRKKDEPMSTEPTVGKTLVLKVNQGGVLEKVK